MSRRLSHFCTLILLTALLGAAGCSDQSSDAAEDGTKVILGPAIPASKPVTKQVAPAAPSALPRSDVRAYAVPPLPPELQDDGDLIPLPPRPSPAELAERAQRTD